MRPIATDVTHSVVCVSVCVMVTRMCRGKTAELIEMLFWLPSRMGPRNRVLDWGRDPHGHTGTAILGVARSTETHSESMLPVCGLHT